MTYDIWRHHDINNDIRSGLENENSLTHEHLNVLNTKQDLDNIRKTAQDRQLWKKISNELYSIAEANLLN